MTSAIAVVVLACLPISIVAFSITPARWCHRCNHQHIRSLKSMVRVMGGATMSTKSKKMKRTKKVSSTGRRIGGDFLSGSEVQERLNKVPVFGIKGKGLSGETEGGWVASKDGSSPFFMDKDEADQTMKELKDQCRKAGKSETLRVEGVALGKVWGDPGVSIAPSLESLNDLKYVPSDRVMDPDIGVPVYGIDGLAAVDSDTNKSVIPLFFSRTDLLHYVGDVYSDAEERVLASDLRVCVSQMLNGPAGLLRRATFIAEEKALVAMEAQEVADLPPPPPPPPISGSAVEGRDVTSGSEPLFPAASGSSESSDTSGSDPLFPTR